MMTRVYVVTRKSVVVSRRTEEGLAPSLLAETEKSFCSSSLRREPSVKCNSGVWCCVSPDGDEQPAAC